MYYNQYLDLVERDLPELQIRLLSLAPPEIVKTVGLELFVKNINTGPLVEESRAQLSYLKARGILNFERETPKNNNAGYGEKSGYKPSEFT